MTRFDTWKRWAGHLKREGLTLWFASRHPQAPWLAKVLGVIVVAYALSPIDLIPDVIPVLGLLDELILLPVLIALALRLLPPAVREASRGQADDWLRAQRGKPRSWAGAALVLAVWVALGVALWRWLG